MGVVLFHLCVTRWMCPLHPFPRSLELAVFAQLGVLVPWLLSLLRLLVSLAFLLFPLILQCRLLLFLLLFLLSLLLCSLPLFLQFTLSLLLSPLLLLLSFPFLLLSLCSLLWVSLSLLLFVLAFHWALPWPPLLPLLRFPLSFLGSFCFPLFPSFCSPVVCRFFVSSFRSFLCPFSRLFGLFSSDPFLISPFVCFLFRSLFPFGVGSGSFPGSSCVLYGFLWSLFSLVNFVPSTSLASSGSFAPSLAPTVPHPPADSSAGPGFSSSLGGEGGLPHVPILLMFMARQVPRLSSPIPYTFGVAMILMAKATRSLMLWGGLTSLLPFVRLSPLLRVSSLPPDPQIPTMSMSPWFDDFGSSHRCDPRVFLSLFDKLAPVKKNFRKLLMAKRPLPPCRPGAMFIDGGPTRLL